MKYGKTLAATAVATLVFGVLCAVQAKPGQGPKNNHPNNHGKQVSAWARSKLRGHEKAKYSKPTRNRTHWDNRNDDRNDYVAPRRSTYRRDAYGSRRYQSPSYTRLGYRPTRLTRRQKERLRRARVQARERQVRQARRNRRATVRTARRDYRQTRYSIVRDGDRRKKLTPEQQRRLREARRKRKAAVRTTRRDYKQTRRQVRS
jgi:hypothetical protein